jgi:hypothetical protein
MIVSRPGSTELAAKWKQVGFDVQELACTIQISDRLDARLVLKLATPDAATSLASMMQSQLQSIKQFFDGGATAEGDTITVDVGMTEAQAKSFAAMIGSLTPQ